MEIAMRRARIDEARTPIVLLLAVWILPVVMPAACGDSAPDGRIVFHSHREGNLGVYVMNADGTGEEAPRRPS